MGDYDSLVFGFDSILDEMEEEEPLHLSPQKLQNLGFKFEFGLEEMFDEAINCCKQKGFL